MRARSAGVIASGILGVLVYGSSEARAMCSVSYSNGGTVATCSGTTSAGGACSWHQGMDGIVCMRFSGGGRPKTKINVTRAMRAKIQVNND